MQNFTMRPASVFAKRMTLVLIVCLLASCSLVRLGYDYGESLSYWWLDGYVDFDANQKPWVKQRLTDLFAWHRKTQLKDYVNLLTQEQKKLQHKVNQSELLIENEGLKERVILLFDRALPDLADIALSLHQSQIAHIEKKFAANNITYRKDFLSGDAEQRQQFRYKKVMEQAEYWFGTFSPEQEELIHKASDARPMNNELRMAVRLKLQQNLIRMLKKIQSGKPSREITMLMLKEYSNDIFEHYGGIEHQEFFDASRDDMANLVMIIISCTTQKQKERAVKKMQQWIDNFNVLVAEGE